MKLVIVESPCAGEWERNRNYANRALRDCIDRGEAPIASHVLLAFSGALDDANPERRAAGMAAGFAWTERADLVAVYVDWGVSSGMQAGIDVALALGLSVEHRRLGRAVSSAVVD